MVHPDNQEPEQLKQLTRQVFATAHQGQRLEAGLIRGALKTGDGLALAEDELGQKHGLDRSQGSLSVSAIGHGLPPRVLNPLEHFALSVFQSGRRTAAAGVGKLKGAGH